MPTLRNVKGPDILVANEDGSAGVTIQVKTTIHAMRTRGRGRDKRPNHYEWDMSWGHVRQSSPLLIYALVDLKDFREMPDVYLVPSSVIATYYIGGDPTTWRRPRYHPAIADIEAYRNNWGLLKETLDGAGEGL